MMKKLYCLLTATLCLSATVKADDWMNQLPDDVFVSRISIPGAHDAATGSGWGTGYASMGNLYARTQDIDLPSLWHAGVRAFDLRPCTRDGYLNINHGIVATAQRFDDALRLLRDSLVAHPSEFVIIHLLHETSGDQVDGTYNTQLLQLLGSDDLKPYLADFRKDLRVADLRGKMLLLSRDKYADTPVGGFFENWTGEANWAKQVMGRIRGINNTFGPLIMQDYADTHNDGGLDTKIAAINRLLTFSTTYTTTSANTVRWVMNFASAYSKVISLFGYEISTSDGYRDNAAHTHAAILDFLENNPAGPTGIVLMDYAGVDESAGYQVKGKQTVEAIIANNFKYLGSPTGIATATMESAQAPEQVYSTDGRRLSAPTKGQINVIRHADGTVTKHIGTRQGR